MLMFGFLVKCFAAQEVHLHQPPASLPTAVDTAPVSNKRGAPPQSDASQAPDDDQLSQPRRKAGTLLVLNVGMPTWHPHPKKPSWPLPFPSVFVLFFLVGYAFEALPLLPVVALHL